MRPFHAGWLVCALLFAGGGAADTPPAAAAPGPPASFTTYYFALLTRGPNSGTGTLEERNRIQAAHLANIRRLHDAGQLLVAGPFADDGDWRGLFIYKCASLDEARALADSDPAVQAGRLKVEIHPWVTMKGVIRDAEFPAAPAAITP